MIRLYAINVFASSQDKFYDGVPINIWSIIEINVAVACSSAPAIKPLFTKSIRERATGSSRTRFGSNYGHQMYPLSDNPQSVVGKSGAFENGKHNGKAGRPTYSANATAMDRGGSEENIVPKHGGIEYEREFTVVESYEDGVNGKKQEIGRGV